jgi:VanZ family protein
MAGVRPKPPESRRGAALPHASGSASAVLATLVYAAGLAYLSLARGGDWECTGRPFLEFAMHASLSRADLLANVVAYVPLGAMIGYAFSGRRSPLGVALLAVMAGGALSAGVEIVQACLPARTSSVADVLANVAGVLLGLLVLLPWRRLVVRRDGSPRIASMSAPPLGHMAVAAIAMWFAQQTFPWVLTLDVGQLRQNFVFAKPLLGGELPLEPWRLARHVANWVSLGLLFAASVQSWAPVLRPTLVAAAVAVLAQSLLAVPTLSLEQFAGLALALPLLVGLRLPVARPLLPPALLIAALSVTTLYQLRPGSGAVSGEFSWLPVFGEGSTLGAIQLGLFFFACSLACAVAVQWRSAGRARLVPAAIAVTALHALLEVAQLRVPGRIADTSTPLLIAVGWSLAIAIQSRATTPAPPTTRRSCA